MAVRQGISLSAVEFSILICLISDFYVQVDSARIIDYGASQNDTRINWDDALPLGSPYEPSLFFWWGDEESDTDAYDLLSMNSGVPVVGPGSLWPSRGTPVPSVMAVSNGPLQVPLWTAQEAADKGTWDSASRKVRADDGEEALRREMADHQRRVRARAAPALRTRGGDGAAGDGARARPAAVHVEFLSATHEEVTFPAFAQETVGDVVARILRRIPRSTDCKMLLAPAPGAEAWSDGAEGVEASLVVGLPRDMAGVPLYTRLAELGYGDGDEVRVVGVWQHESPFPRYEVVSHSLEAYLNDRQWPPCENLGKQEPLNHLIAGDTAQTAGHGAEVNNQPSNMIVVLSEAGRTCYNKHALAAYLTNHEEEPVSGKKADRLFKAQVKASLLMDIAYMPIYLTEALYHSAHAVSHDDEHFATSH